ncbi:hypothetical protein GCM10022419_117530 [Nonomuraea rosea]|uniref:Uncharacterized protein n=1 Tax=Nonomuraea rosea TaxID=638574 RepID=A0ABP6ZPS2_9ACTN
MEPPGGLGHRAALQRVVRTVSVKRVVRTVPVQRVVQTVPLRVKTAGSTFGPL